ncbi:hypothetical protein ACRB8A_20160 (plasmid) [Arthrobacter sp. G.S.26]|uniref:hypothetical protein n=1 Tax=Arthrobacter sp. G.S.26 TaxID=3433706 RepID=UPI003D776393
MHISDERLVSTVDFLRVAPPPPPSPAVRRNDITGIKLARHVAVLFGVDVPENPTETVWVSDFNKVSVGDIGRGAPKLSVKKNQKVGPLPLKGWYLVNRALVAGPSTDTGIIGAAPPVRVEGVDEVPSATLNRFKPDTKAAALLAGADRLFAGLEETFKDTLRVLGTLEDGTLLADNVRIGIWASLLAEVYRSQPALFTAAVQARLTQRAALSQWQPRVSLTLSTESATCEFGAEGNDDYWEPTTLGILDGVIRDYVRPSIGPGLSSPSALTKTRDESVDKNVGPDKNSAPIGAETDGSPAGSDDPNRDYLIDGLVDRWCRHLTQSSDRGLTWTVQEQSRRSVDIYLSGLTPLSRFLTEIQLLSPQILPYGEDSRGETSQWLPLDVTLEKHRRRIRPRIPSRAELSPLPEKSQKAIIHTLICLHRALRGATAFRDRGARMLQEIRDDEQRVAELSASLWGAEAPLSTWSHHMSLRSRIEAARDKDPGFVDANWGEFITSYRKLRFLRESEGLTVGEWVDIFIGSSVTINARSRDLGIRGGSQEKEAKALRAELHSDWQNALRLLNIDVEATKETLHGADNPAPGLTQVALLLHNYLGVALQAPSEQERLAAIRFGRNVVVPTRRRVAEDRKNDNVVRLSIQIVLGAAAKLAAETSNQRVRQELLLISSALLKDLLETKLVKELRTGHKAPEEASDLYVLNAISSAALTLHENGENSPLSRDDTLRVLDMAATALGAMTEGRPNGPEKETSRSQNVRVYRERWDKLNGTA